MAEQTPTEAFHKNNLIGASRLPVKEQFDSMPVRVTIGCQNKSKLAANGQYKGCAFCRAYELEGEEFRVRPIEEVKSDILQASNFYEAIMPSATHAFFLGDADALVAPTEMLVEILGYMQSQFREGGGEPKIKAVKSYASVKSILNKELEELKRLRGAGLTGLYVGFESGDDDILRVINKGVSSKDSVAAGLKLNEAGIQIYASLIWGIGGRERTRQHAIATANLLNQFGSEMIIFNHLFYPDLLKERCENYTLPTKEQLVKEAHMLLERLTTPSRFVATEGPCADMAIEGRLPQDKEKIKKIIEEIVKESNPRRCAY